MKVSSPMKIQELREKLAAFTAAEAAASAVTTAHIAMRTSGIAGGCEDVMTASREAVKVARKAFKSAYAAEADSLDDDGAAHLHNAVWGE